MKVGIIGLGTVGEGVLKVLTLEKENIKIKSNCELEVKYACDLNTDRQFSFATWKSSTPCLAISALFAVTTFFFALNASSIIVLASVSPPINSITISTSGSFIILL